MKMEGRVSGSQPVSIRWFKDDTEIHSSDKYDISFKSNVAVLCIKISQVTDSGRYTCQASNEAGRASCDVTVGISGEFRCNLPIRFTATIQAILPATLVKNKWHTDKRVEAQQYSQHGRLLGRLSDDRLISLSYMAL